MRIFLLFSYFSIFYDDKLNIFGFQTIGQTKQAIWISQTGLYEIVLGFFFLLFSETIDQTDPLIKKIIGRFTDNETNH